MNFMLKLLGWLYNDVPAGVSCTLIGVVILGGMYGVVLLCLTFPIFAAVLGWIIFTVLGLLFASVVGWIVLTSVFE